MVNDSNRDVGHLSRVGLSKLTDAVRARVLAEKPTSGRKILDCLDTAAELIKFAQREDKHLRLTESAAYNLREAMDAVVVDNPAADGGMPAIEKAWARYRATHSTDRDKDLAWEELTRVLGEVIEDSKRQTQRARRLIGYLRSKTGVDRVEGVADPVSEYSDGLARANRALHTECDLPTALSLFEDVIAWFVRMFTPPDAQVRALVDLAEEPYRTSSQIEKLRSIATNAHHLRLVFSRIKDPAWLPALFEAKLIQLPQPEQPWLESSLIANLGANEPQAIAELLGRLLEEAKKLPKERRGAVRFELLRASYRLGRSGHAVATQVMRLHKTDRWVQTIGANIVDVANPADEIVEVVADAVLDGGQRRYHCHERKVLVRLEEGLDLENISTRTLLLAAKLRRVARATDSRFVPWDPAALTVTVDDDECAPVLVLAHYFVRMSARARSLGIETERLLELSQISGELGERIACQLLAHADDIPLHHKIDHVAQRMKSSTVTGDDRDLVLSVLSSDRHADFAVWSGVWGEPSPMPDAPLDDRSVPEDWARAWRWSGVLPPDVVSQWQAQISHVTQVWGDPSAPEAFERRLAVMTSWSHSPYTGSDLAGLPVLEAAARISAWRPQVRKVWPPVNARQLARELEEVVKSAAPQWVCDPIAVVRGLREPVYIQHYFRALADPTCDVSRCAEAILDAIDFARTVGWEPVQLGTDSFEFEPDWSGVDIAAVDLIAALANRNGIFADRLDAAWSVALALTNVRPEESELVDQSNVTHVLESAINRPWGRGLEAVLALARWEHRNHGEVRSQFGTTLDGLLKVPGRIGMEFRAILAAKRTTLEESVPVWLEDRAAQLFQLEPQGAATFDLTVEWSYPTEWLLARYPDELFDAARRGVEHAVPTLLIGFFQYRSGYDEEAVLSGLQPQPSIVNLAGAEVARMVQPCDSGTDELRRGVDFWAAMLDASRRLVPADSLVGLGRWAYVEGVDEDTWTHLMGRTVELTVGSIDYPLEVASRCAPTALGLTILRQLLGNGELWEQDHVARTALQTLRVAAVDGSVEEEFNRLRTRLLELGYHDAAGIVGEHRDGGAGHEVVD